MLTTIWFLVRCFGFAAVCAALILLTRCGARADALEAYALILQQQALEQQQYQQGIDSLTNYLTQQQYLANQRMQWTAPRAIVCTQQGIFMVCQ